MKTEMREQLGGLRCTFVRQGKGTAVHSTPAVCIIYDRYDRYHIDMIIDRHASHSQYC